MQPLRLAQNTNKFQQLPSGKYMPVPPNQQSSYNTIQSSIYDLPENSLELPPVSVHDFQQCLNTSKASVCQDDLDEFV